MRSTMQVFPARFISIAHDDSPSISSSSSYLVNVSDSCAALTFAALGQAMRSWSEPLTLQHKTTNVAKHQPSIQNQLPRTLPQPFHLQNTNSVSIQVLYGSGALPLLTDLNVAGCPAVSDTGCVALLQESLRLYGVSFKASRHHPRVCRVADCWNPLTAAAI